MNEINIEAIKSFYNLLKHKQQTEIRAFELDEDFKNSKCKGHIEHAYFSEYNGKISLVLNDYGIIEKINLNGVENAKEN